MEDNECKGCQSLIFPLYARAGCAVGLDRTPNCPCQFCLVKVTCTKGTLDTCDKFKLHRTYYGRRAG